MKWAETQDGFLDVCRDENHPIQPTWITNEYSKTLVHKWRSEEQAILIGTNTANTDNPSLTTRNWPGKNPLRIVFDRNLELSSGLNIFNSDAETIVIADVDAKQLKKKYLNNKIGIEFVEYDKGFDLQLFNALVNRNIQSLIVEGGERVLNYFIERNLWDEARIFIGNKVFIKGIAAPKIERKIIKEELLGDSKLFLIKNKRIFNQ